MKKFKSLIFYFFLFNSFDLYADPIVYEIKAKNINYEKNKKTIIATGDAEAKSQDNKKIFADKILYNKDLDLITTEGNSRFFDNKKISISAEKFVYDLKLRTISASKNVIININDEKYEFNDFKYYEQNQSGSGNKFKSKSKKDGSTIIAENAELSLKSGIKTLTKSKYTPCKIKSENVDEFCPNWSATSSSATHDKERQTIIYKNTFLNLKNIPVIYVPYLAVPDPTVKRQTGFLNPSIQKLSNLANTIKLPYFFAISDDKDLTFTPVLYSKENNLYLASYRQQFKNSYLEIDTSFTKGYDNTDSFGRTSGSRNHLFADFQGNYKNIFFDNTDVKLKLQNVNNSTYLLVNQINTNLVKSDLRNLENSIQVNSYGKSESLILKGSILQNLDASNLNRYEYIMPQIVYSTYKNIENHQLNFSSSFLAKNFSTNQTQENFTNTINTSSNQYIFKNYGLGTSLKTNITNININNNNVSGQKENLSSENFFTLALDNALPLYKKNIDSNLIQDLTPRIFAKYTTGKMTNLSTSDKVLNYNDIYSMDRMNNPISPETGFSIATGIDWGLTKKNTNNENILKSTLSLGQVFKQSRNMNMPNSSSLQNASSDMVGSYDLKYFGEKNIFENTNKISGLPNFTNNYIGINYQFNIDNNFSAINRNLLTISGIYKSNYLSTSFEDKKNHIGDSSSAIFSFKKLLSNMYFFDFETKKNFKQNYTEFSKIGFSREDECLKIGFGYQKQSYSNLDLRPNKTIYFTITFKPFGEAGRADLSSFVK